MKYLKASVMLRTLIRETNDLLLHHPDEVLKEPNQMRILFDNGEPEKVVMSSFTNEFVRETLETRQDSMGFLVTDIATMKVEGNDVYYILYKGYHSEIEKAMVFYQVIDNQTLAPLGPLDFSHMEENIFYEVEMPESEESSCNAMETNREVIDGKSIVFLIGHMDEERLAYDIERLIFDTVHNVTKHPRLQFNFIVHISHFGGKPSDKLKQRVKAIDEYTRKHIIPVYPNTSFEFAYEQDGTLG